MVIKNVVRGIGLVLVMMSVVWIVMAAIPTLTDGGVLPSSGDTSTTFTFTVTFTDASNHTADYVNLSLDGIEYLMNEANSGDVNTTDGKSYTLSKGSLSGATHYYNFTAKNGTDIVGPTGGGSFVVRVAPSITSPLPASPVNSSVNTTQNFNVTVNQDANVSWKLNGIEVQNLSVAAGGKSDYSNSSIGAGTYDLTAIAINANGTSSPQKWIWTVSFPTLGPVGSAPQITGVNAKNIKDTSADITFTVNQSDAKTRVKYGTDSSLSSGSEIWSDWKNNTPWTIPLSGLNKNTTYYFSVYAYNGTNESLFSNISSPFPSFTTLDPTAPNVTVNTITPGVNTASIAFSVNQSDAKTRVEYGTDSSLSSGSEIWSGWNNNTPSPTITLYNLSSGTTYYYSIYAYNGTNESCSYNSSISNFTTTYPPPTITVNSTPSSLNATVGDSLFFEISVNQPANVTWKLGLDIIRTDNILAGGRLNYTFKPTAKGTYNVSVSANNTNGTDIEYWLMTVHPKTYSKGNRVWDGGKQDEYSLNYIWDPLSFYAFYYDLDTGVGNEALEITLRGYADRNIQKGALKYKTTPYSVSFKQSKWGNYDVIGFMADKYFAGYTPATKSDITSNPVSPLNSNQLHKILMDDNTQRVVSAGSTLTLQEGYIIKIKDVDASGRIVLLSLLKDGGEIDTQPVSQGGTYVYTKKVGAVSDLPIIAVRIDNVFSGKETSAAFTKGIFQISESFTSAKSDNRYGIMEITSASASGIEMVNSNSFTLSQGSTIDIMGDMKFIVADNSSVLRFAPMVKRSGTYEVRGTIAQDNDTSFEWTPMNFEGFYYNINDDVGTEKLSITRSGTSTSVSKGNLIYTSTPQPVSYKYSKFGTFNVIGFMADTYFAGYIGCGTCITSKDISTIGYKQLHRVLVDDDTQRVIYAGSTLTLNDGYVLKIKDVNIGAGAASVWLSLLKDGSEIYEDVKNEGEIFTYAPSKVGAVNDLPIIALRIDKIFRGKEATAAFTKGVFQISEKCTSVKQGDRFGIMEVSEVSNNQIQMDNPGSFTLSSASTIDVMGNIKFKIAYSSEVRFYPFIMANGTALTANQLSISVPPSMMVKDTITIGVTSGAGTPEGNAEVSFDGEVIGTTNSTGKLDYLLTRAGQHNLTATKLGFEKATKTVQISEYVDNRLSFELPEFIDQYIPVSIKVKVSGTGNVTSGVNVTFDGKSIGKTDSNGILTYTFTESGTHNLAASKPGYIEVQREINIRLPFIEFKALDINFRPDIVARGQNVYVWANITNSGTKEGMLPVALIINSTVVENSNVTLAPGKQGEVNFSHKIDLLPGNYTVEILGQKTTMPVKEEPLNLFLVAGIITILGAVSIFFMTSKDIISIEALKAKLNMAPPTNRPVINTDAINRAINDIVSKFKKK